MTKGCRFEMQSTGRLAPDGMMMTVGPITYGQRIDWTNRDGSTEGVEVTGCKTVLDARCQAVALARKRGWTHPRWWQIRRWGDTRVPLCECGNAMDDGVDMCTDCTKEDVKPGLRLWG